ncbi:hypothetical protein PR048_001500 [Dryococelus australis]|uniref:Reverse transcriptase Ty1/copia-type domain-containing protein n=1 Tax=Dryococelus australis TaxID=614101 RepID=A0ABQ9IHM0_9NEOP|nr:hypothetical protein PR048_001500 [Dryococelus australis]
MRMLSNLAMDGKKQLKTKKDVLKKAIAKVFQEEQANNVYVPVARLPTFVSRYLLQYRVNAFLNGYIKTPGGVKNEPGKVLKFKISLYGLPSAPRKWYKIFHNFMVTHGMKRSVSDFCLYIGENVWLVIWVDDMLITGEKTKFEQVYRNNDLNYGDEVKISQINFINTILSKFNTILCKGVNTPIVCDFMISKLTLKNLTLKSSHFGI